MSRTLGQKEFGMNVLPNKSHRTKKVIIKREDIDIGIVEIVNWLNSFESVITKFSCEGYGKEGDPYVGYPYVTFICDDKIDLMNILRILGNSATIEVSLEYINRSNLQYTLRFPSKTSLKHFNDHVKNKKLGENR